MQTIFCSLNATRESVHDAFACDHHKTSISHAFKGGKRRKILELYGMTIHDFQDLFISLACACVLFLDCRTKWKELREFPLRG